MSRKADSLDFRSRSRYDGQQGGFALVAVLVLLAALYLGATGIFLAARAELQIGVSHAAASQAFYLAEAGLTTWMASTAQPSTAVYAVGNGMVTVTAIRLVRVDSVATLYRITARATIGGVQAGDPGRATRGTSVLGMRIGDAPVTRVRRTLREIL